MQCYTPPEVAKRLRVRKDRVYKWINSGELEATRLPLERGLRITEAGLQKFIERYYVFKKNKGNIRDVTEKE